MADVFRQVLSGELQLALWWQLRRSSGCVLIGCEQNKHGGQTPLPPHHHLFHRLYRAEKALFDFTFGSIVPTPVSMTSAVQNDSPRPMKGVFLLSIQARDVLPSKPKQSEDSSMQSTTVLELGSVFCCGTTKQ
ncbi:uncharacterized protein LOC122979036 isoform X2 [Thunnus albacares]|uniref:uncharacterized protein LOC122979036 isoform X2 n=1 Tax=Thunnus albacares TaxID=8236 RepID=UPI001CF693A8|nr:uncharacterized protein LOC122979036 isoform X2 [Thunnus albacares]